MIERCQIIFATPKVTKGLPKVTKGLLHVTISVTAIRPLILINGS